jgi:hypothetical protein
MTRCVGCIITGCIALVFIGAALFFHFQPQPGYDYAAFVNELRMQQPDLVENGTVGTDMLHGTRRLLTIHGEQISVYEYRSSAARENDQHHLDSSGSTYSTRFRSMIVDWIAPPHWYSKERIIVLYVGTDETIMASLQQMLGPEFAGAQAQQALAQPLVDGQL